MNKGNKKEPNWAMVSALSALASVIIDILNWFGIKP